MTTADLQRADLAMFWLDRLGDFIEHRVSSARFRRKAAENPISRPIARNQARTLFDLCAGFVYSQTLLACVRLHLFEILHERPRTPGELVKLIGLPRDRVDILLGAAEALSLVRRRTDATYGLATLGASLIENAGLLAMIEHRALFYRDLEDPVALLKAPQAEGALAAFWPYRGAGADSGLSGQSTQAYTQLMAASQAMIAEEVVSSYPFARHRKLLDVGGGAGVFAVAVASKCKALRLCVLDLPSVAEHARANIVQAGLVDRIDVAGGDFLNAPLPEGADIVTFVRVLHDHDDEAVLQALSAAARALPKNGTLLIAEPMREADAPARVTDAYFALYLLAMGRGRPRSPDDYFALLSRAGLRQMQLIDTKVPLLTAVVTARRA